MRKATDLIPDGNGRRAADMKIIKTNLIILTVLAASAVCAESPAASTTPYTEINLSQPQKSQTLSIDIPAEQTAVYGWRPGQNILVQFYVDKKNGEKIYLKDIAGNKSWHVVLGQNGAGRLTIKPSPLSFTGRLTIKANNRFIASPTPSFQGNLGKTLEKVQQYTFTDGVTIKVHFTDQMMEEGVDSEAFAREVLDAAVSAYQTITVFKGFSANGYSLANPNYQYAYDPDKTIDIFLGDTSEKTGSIHGFNAATFKDAPCFDTIKLSSAAYDAVILIPANYAAFIKNWEKINPSYLGQRSVSLDLRGTLIHEMLHAIIFYYNKNLNKEEAATSKTIDHQKIDWYVEGLARYFETFSGAKHDFYSQGFKQTLPGKIRFSRGGSNYFMRYPDQAFIELRYENALFWRYLDNRFGMKAIEKLSRDMRDFENRSYRLSLERATGEKLETLLQDFAVASLFKDFGLKEDSVYLKEIARTRLAYRNDGLYLLQTGSDKRLGNVCKTDWVGKWEDQTADVGQNILAGDHTEQSDVSGWATDFYEINMESDRLPWLGVAMKEGGYSLLTQIVLMTRGGSRLHYDLKEIHSDQKEGLNLEELTRKEGLEANDIQKIYVLITNTDPIDSAEYELLANN